MKYLYDEIERLRELTDKMPGDEGKEAAEAMLDGVERLEGIGQTDKGFKILKWVEEDIILPNIEEPEEGIHDVVLTLSLNLGTAPIGLTHSKYLAYAIKNKSLKDAKVQLVSYK